jgi:hypothetical protein
VLEIATGEWSAVGIKTGQAVSHSVPGLAVPPTPPLTTGRTPGTRPPVLPAAGGYTCQPKSVPGFGAGSPEENCEREALASNELDDLGVSQLIQLFQLLNKWDGGAHATKTM